MEDFQRSFRLVLAVFFLYFPFQYLLSADVNYDGSLTEQISLNLPPARSPNPQLSLVYNSNNLSSKWVGIGWQLVGIPAIQRISHYRNIEFNGNDEYQGPEGRLIDVSGNKTLYHNDKENWSKFEPDYSCSLPANEPCSWTMYDASGNKYYFGTTSDSFIEAIDYQDNQINGGVARAWALAKVEAPSGNYYEIEYEKDNGQFYPSKITYTKGNGTSNYRYIDFTWDKTSRLDYGPYFNQGSKVENRWRLSFVNISSDCGILCTEDIRSYVFLYEESEVTSKSRLVSVQEFSASGYPINPIILEWSPEEDFFTEYVDMSHFSGIVGNLYGYTYKHPSGLGDFNGDGRADIHRTFDTPASLRHNANRLYLGGVINFNYASVHYNLAGVPLLGNDGYSNMYTTIRPNYADFDGDGRLDILRAGTNPSYNNLYLSTGTDFSDEGQVISGIPLISNDNSIQIRFADFNGDGRSDVLRVSNNPANNKIFLSQGNAFVEVSHPFGSTVLENSTRTIVTKLVDVNGDGKTDILILSDNPAGNYLWLSSDSGFTVGMPVVQSELLHHSNANIKSLFIDLNGDGKVDIFRAGDDPADNHLWLGDGKSFHDYGSVLTTNILYQADGSIDLSTADFNGDGRFELFKSGDFDSSSDANNPIWIYMGGTNFVRQLIPVLEQQEYHSFQNSWNIQPNHQDFNGDGKADIFGGHGFDYFPSNPAHSNKLISKKNGLQALTEFEYSNAAVNGTTNSDPCTNSWGGDCGQPDVQARLRVTQISQKQNASDTNPLIATYTYHNPRFRPKSASTHPKGVFLGYGTISKSTPLEHLSRNYVHDERFLGHMSGSTRQRFSGDVDELLNFDYTARQFQCDESGCAEAFGADVAYPSLMVVDRNMTVEYTENNEEIRRIDAFNTQYDEFMNVTAGYVVRSGNGLSETTYKEATYINAPSGAARTIGLPSYEKSFVDTDIPENILFERRFLYDNQPHGSAGSLLKRTGVEQWAGGTNWISSSTTYHGNGNLASQTTKGVTKSYDYESVFDAFVDDYQVGSLTTEFKYDYRFGVISESHNSNDVINVHIFDEFGRPIEQQVREGDFIGSTLIQKTTFDYQLSDGNNYSEKCNYIGINLTTPRCERIYFDNLGRKTKQVSLAINGSTETHKTQVFQYDTLHRHYRTSEPFFSDITGSGTPTRFTEKQYDLRNRVTQVDYPDGTSKTFSVGVSGLAAGSVYAMTETDENAVSKVTYLDLHKRPKKVTQAYTKPEEASVEYAYSLTGNLIQTTAPQGITTIDYYDGTFLRKSITEPNSGTTQFEYFDNPNLANFGLLQKEIRPAVNSASGTDTVLYEYNDALNRVTKISYEDGAESTFSYDNASQAFAIGKLTEVTHSSGGYQHSLKYSYDVFGNANTIERNIGHTSQTLCSSSNQLPCKSVASISYDHLNRVSQVNYPDGTTSTNDYFGATGLINTISHDGVQNAQYSQYNVFDQAQQITYGNGTTNNITYSTTDRRLERSEWVDGANDTLLDYNYQFDNVGNITNITDNFLTDLSQTYTYDSLNRVKTANRTSSNLSFAFNSKGGITDKPGRKIYYQSNSTRIDYDEIYDTGSSSWQLNNSYSYSSSGNILAKGATSFSYDSQSMLSQTIKSSGDTAENYYDHSGQRFLKVFQQVGKPEIRSYYFGGIYEFREKWESGSKKGHQATKYILGADGNPLASMTAAPVNVASTDQQLKVYYASIGLFSTSTLSGVFNRFIIQARVFIAKNFFAVTDSGRLSLFILYLSLGLLLLLALRFIFGLHLKLLLYRDTVPIGSKTLLSIPIQQYKLHILLPQTNRYAETVQTLFAIKHRKLAFSALAVCLIFFNTYGCSDSENPTVTTDPDTGQTIIEHYTATFDTIYDGLPAGTYYYHKNHLETASLITDETGEEVLRLNYTPYGIIDTSISGVYDAIEGEIDNIVDTPEHLLLATRFTGQSYDPENELYYYNARYYDPGVGQFTTADSIVDGADTVMGYNRYAYVHGNPIRYNDPTGHWFNSSLGGGGGGGGSSSGGATGYYGTVGSGPPDLGASYGNGGYTAGGSPQVNNGQNPNSFSLGSSGGGSRQVRPAVLASSVSQAGGSSSGSAANSSSLAQSFAMGSAIGFGFALGGLALAPVAGAALFAGMVMMSVVQAVTYAALAAYRIVSGIAYGIGYGVAYAAQLVIAGGQAAAVGAGSALSRIPGLGSLGGKAVQQGIALGKTIGLDNFAAGHGARTLMSDPNYMNTIQNALKTGQRIFVDLTGIGGRVGPALQRAVTGRGSAFDAELLLLRDFFRSGGTGNVQFFLHGVRQGNPFR